MKKILLSISTLSVLAFSCQDNSELTERVEKLEEQVEQLSAKNLITNPATVNNPAAQVVNDGPKSAIQMTESEHDFGTITEGDVPEHVFTFTNTGENPLIISNAKGSCGCTVPEWPKNPIAPGEAGEILVKFNSKGKVGQQRKSVTVTANTDPANTQFFITANVLKGEGSTTTPVAQPIQVK